MKRIAGGTMDKYTILKTYYGYDAFRGGQEVIIDHILKGKDVGDGIIKEMLF